jgi:hypothetical protein
MPPEKRVKKAPKTTAKTAHKPQKKISSYGDLIEKERNNRLRDEDIVAALKKVNFQSMALRNSLGKSLLSPFTHNPRLGTGCHGRDIAPMAISWSPSLHTVSQPAGTYSFASSGHLVEDVVDNAAYDSVARILNRPWKVASRPAPVRPREAILARDPAYADLWRNPIVCDLLQAIQAKARQAGRVCLGNLAGAPMVHFPLSRPREDVDAPPAYALLCLLPSNAAIEAAGRGGPAYAADPDAQPRTRRVRILPTPAASNNLTGLLRKQDHLAMLLTPLPLLPALSDWTPETPLRFDAASLEPEVAAYNAFLRDGRIANKAYRERAEACGNALVGALFRGVSAARAEGVRPDEAPDGSDTDALIPLLKPEPSEAEVEKAAAAAAAFLLTRIDATAIPPATPDRIQEILRQASLRCIRQILADKGNDR